MITKVLRQSDYARLRVRHRDDALDDLVLRGAVRYDTVSAVDRAAILSDAKAGDLLSMRAVLHIHAGLVEHFSRRAWSRCVRATAGFGIDDLRQVGRMGLVRAVQKFDPARGVSFGTYASVWIRSSINRCIDNQISQIHVPVWARSDTAAQRKHKLRTTIREAVEAASLPTVDVDELSLSAAFDDDSERKSQLRFVRRVIKHLAKQGALTPRDVEIVMRRYTTPGETLKEVGDSMGLSRERIRQIEATILDIVRFAVRRPDLVHLKEQADLAPVPKRLRSWYGREQRRVRSLAA